MGNQSDRKKPPETTTLPAKQPRNPTSSVCHTGNSSVVEPKPAPFKPDYEKPIPPELLAKHPHNKVWPPARRIFEFSWEGLLLDQIPSDLRYLIGNYCRGQLRDSYKAERFFPVSSSNCLCMDASGLLYTLQDNRSIISKTICVWKNDGTKVHEYLLPSIDRGRPYSIGCFDLEGNLLLVDWSTAHQQMCIATFDPSRGQISSSFVVKHPHGTSSYNIAGVAVDNEGNVLFTCNRYQCLVKCFKEGGLQKLIGGIGTSLEMKSPSAVVVNRRNGNILITETMGNRILVLNSDGKFLRSIGSQGKLDGQLHYPDGLVIDDCGSVLVAEKLNHRISIFSETGQFMMKLDLFSMGIWDPAVKDKPYPFGPSRPQVDVKGNVYLADPRWQNIQVLVYNNDR